MNINWIGDDRTAVRAIIGGDTALGFPGWTATKVAHPRRDFNPPDYTTSPDLPVIFLGWGMGGYEHVDNGTFGDQGPGRQGFINLLWHVQPGRGGGSVLDVRDTGFYSLLIQLFVDAEASGNSSLSFNPPIPVQDEKRTVQNRSWYVEGMKLRFVAG